MFLISENISWRSMYKKILKAILLTFIAKAVGQWEMQQLLTCLKHPNTLRSPIFLSTPFPKML